MSFNKEEAIAKANAFCKNTLIETLNIEFIDIENETVVARMPVTSKVHQPDGILHGGATAALAESCGSFASHIFLDTENLAIRGIEINVNHLKSVKDGYVYAKATFIHKGRTTQLLEVKITDEQERLISICKLTTIAIPKA